MSRTKWTLDSLRSEEDEEDYSGLPQLKEISRASLADPEFAAPAFLSEHCQYRTLRDVQDLVADWERKLESELISTMNARFVEFVNAVDTAQQSESSLLSVRADLNKFSSQSDRVIADLAEIEQQISQELENHKKLSIEESRAQMLLHMFDLLAELESTVPDIPATDELGLITLAKLYVSVIKIATELNTAKAITVLRGSIETVGRELERKLETRVANVVAPDLKLDLLTAREFVLAAKLPGS